MYCSLLLPCWQRQWRQRRDSGWVIYVKKIDSHTAHGEKRTTFGRLLMCGLIFGMLLSAIPAVVAASEVVTFNDDGLEAAVREALDKSVGDITAVDMAGISELDASDRGITDHR